MMLHHISFAVSDLARAAAFYDATLAALGCVRVWTHETAVGYGPMKVSEMASKSRFPKTFTWAAIAVLAALFTVKTLFVGYYRIPQNGMYPGLPAGSRLFTVKRPYRDASSVKRGDIVVFVREENGQRYNYIWRVVALPGELVVTSDEALIINGQPVQRQRVHEADGKTIFREQIGDVSYEICIESSSPARPPDASVTVPSGAFFVMGDNRFDARDSRYFGPIPFSSITGRKL
jgi:signal peptidase I